MWFNAIKGWIKKAIAPTHSVPRFPRFSKNRVYIVQYKNGQFSIWHTVGEHNNQSDCNTLTWFMVALLHILHLHLQFTLHTTVDTRHEKEECSISPTYTWSKKRVQPLLIHPSPPSLPDCQIEIPAGRFGNLSCLWHIFNKKCHF